VRIRAAAPEDAAAIAAIYAPHVTSGIATFELDPPDAGAMRGRMAASEGYYPWLVVADAEDAVLGYAYATKFRERAAYRYVVETTIYMADGAAGRGLGRLLYQALIDTLVGQGFTQAIGAIALPNPASVGLHEAVGFHNAGIYREVGFKQGQWIDVGIWQRELAGSSVPPVEPRRFVDIRPGSL